MSLCLIRSLKYLAPFSLVADLFIGNGTSFCSFFRLNFSIAYFPKLLWKFKKYLFAIKTIFWFEWHRRLNNDKKVISETDEKCVCLIKGFFKLLVLSLLLDSGYFDHWIFELFAGICVITSMYYSLSVATSLNNVPAWKSIHGLLRFCGVCIYSIDGIGVSLPIENNMRQPKYFSIVLQCGKYTEDKWSSIPKINQYKACN